MDKTIGTKFPEEEVAILEKMASEKKETVSLLVREMIRNAIKQAGNGESGKETNPPASDPKLDEILTILRSKSAQELSSGGGSDETKKIVEKVELLSDVLPLLAGKMEKLLGEIGRIPKSEGLGTGGGTDPKPIPKIDISGPEKSVREISLALAENEKKAKNIGGYLAQAEEKAENILGGMAWKISLILVCIGAGFVVGGYALARYAMPDIPALKKEESALKESIRVLSSLDPKKLDLTNCGGKPCVRVLPGQDQPWRSGENEYYLVDPMK